MASMVYRPAASRFALGALLLAPAMCMAGEPAPSARVAADTAHQARTGMAPAYPAATSSEAAAIAEWQSLTRDPRPSFDRVAAFLIAHPGWPNESDLRRAAENALDVNGYIPASAEIGRAHV